MILTTGSGSVIAAEGAEEGHVYDLGVGPHDYFRIKFQQGPVEESGHNGIQSEQVIAVLIHRLGILNKAYPCRENSLAITKLEEALHWLEARTSDRRRRAVEGQTKP